MVTSAVPTAAPAASLTWPTSVGVTAWPKTRGPDTTAIKSPHNSRIFIHERRMEKPLFDAYLSATELTHIRNGPIDVCFGRYARKIACKRLHVKSRLILSRLGS